MSNKAKHKFEDAPEVAEMLPDVLDKVIEAADNLPAGEMPKIKCLFALGDKLNYRGKICLTSGPWRYLNDYDYVVIIALGDWTDNSPLEREAVLFHELCHIGYRENAKGEITWALRRHSVEVFPEEVKAYGAWRPGLDDLRGAFVSNDLASGH